MRFQYINTKEVRLVIGTWNVAGRLPKEDLEIDSWLCTKELADSYIIGFQEAVQLNAGNVLGVKDSTPISKWEALISAPLSPVQKSCVDAVSQVVVNLDSKPPKALNSSARIGLNEAEKALVYDNGMKCSHHSSGKLYSMWNEQQLFPEVVDSLSDVTDTLSHEENETLNEFPRKQEDNGVDTMKSSCLKYVRIVNKQMVGICVSVWV
ncbi:hypothetical protein K1719_024292 [Acacia pycnantha]|nr:hypothetical protein K1719_024292 [Acacia pycnantha]